MKPTRFPRARGAQAERVRSLASIIGAQLRRARETRKLSQDAAATTAGTWQTTLSRLECGRPSQATFETFLRLLDQYQLSIELVPRDAAVARYREEKEAAAARRGQRDLFAEAKGELERATRRRVS